MNGSLPTVGRAHWMSLLAKAPPGALATAAEQYGALPSFQWLRRPETGLAMVRGRIGGTGRQFNVGEMSMVRCALRLQTGEMGIAYVAGRDKRHAELAAIFDALMQSDAHPRVSQMVLRPIEAILDERRAQTLARAESTRVEFLTMVRGEDA